MMNFELQEAKTSRHTLLTADNAANDILLTVPVGLECSALIKAKGMQPMTSCRQYQSAWSAPLQSRQRAKSHSIC